MKTKTHHQGWHKNYVAIWSFCVISVLSVNLAISGQPRLWICHKMSDRGYGDLGHNSEGQDIKLLGPLMLMFLRNIIFLSNHTVNQVTLFLLT